MAGVPILWKSAEFSVEFCGCIFCKGLLLFTNVLSNTKFTSYENMSSYSSTLQDFLHSFNPNVYHSFPVWPHMLFNRPLSSEVLETLNYCLLSLCSFVFLWRALGGISVSPNAIKHSHVLFSELLQEARPQVIIPCWHSRSSLTDVWLPQ